MKTKDLLVLLIVLSLITTGVQANQAPIADAGPDQIVSMRDTVTLNGMGSHDSDPSGTLQLTFFWEFVRSERASGDWYMAGPIDMSDPDQPIVTFTAPPSSRPLFFR